MNIGQSIASVFLASLLCACGGGDGVDTTGRLDAPTEHGIVSSVAGWGSGGFADGKISKLDSPTAVAVGSDGVVYVADTRNHTIRKVAVDGTVSTLAGNVVVDDAGHSSGVAGFADGKGNAASFSSPRGIAVDASGYVYVADSGNNRIRKISPDGDVTTLAGSGVAGSQDDANPLAATFDDPRGIAVDSSGSTVYVSDYKGHVIRSITATGVVTVAGLAGVSGAVNGAGASARLYKPWGLALSSRGFLYVADCGDYVSNHLIRKIELSSAEVSTLAGTVGVFGKLNDPLPLNASFSGPSGVAVDSNEVVYVADTGNSLIRKIAATGEVTTLAGDGTPGAEDATGTEASFSSPRGIAVDSHGDVYVADTDNSLIRKIKK